jgi:hypothetical protein
MTLENIIYAVCISIFELCVIYWLYSGLYSSKTLPTRTVKLIGGMKNED